MESERFPNKPLIKISGHPMIAHVALRSKLSKLVEDAIVCTDAPEIIKVCDLYGIKSILTKSTHKNGTERIAEAVEILKLGSNDQIIDVQGDEPLVHPKYIEAVSEKLNKKDVECVVPFQEIHIKNEINIVKIIESHGKMLAFSRADVPTNFGGLSQALKKHLDVIGFKISALKYFSQNQPGPLEQTERVELYRVPEGGGFSRVIAVEEVKSSRQFLGKSNSFNLFREKVLNTLNIYIAKNGILFSSFVHNV